MDLRQATLLVALLSACAGGSGCTGGGADPAPPERVATVNGEPITAADYRAALELDERENQGLARSPEALEENRRQLLQLLVDKKLLAQAARKHGVQVSQEDVERAFLRLRADWPGESFDRLLTEQQLTTADLHERIREKLLTERLFAEEVFARIAITDDEVERWLAENRDALSTPERVRAAQLVVKSEEEARKLASELRRGADFAELARRHSLSPDARAGGDLGFFARGEMPPQFEDVCFALATGRVSDVVASPYGFHLFKVLERRVAERPSPEQQRARAEQRLRQEKEREAQADYLEGLRGAARIELDEAAVARLKGHP